MDLRWTEESAADLEQIADYLFEHRPSAAAEIVNQMYASISALVTFPTRGRHGKTPETRELVLWSLPWLVIYRIAGETIHILRILHGAQKRP